MYTGISDLYKYQRVYCSFIVLYKECKWWQFIKKSVIKKQLDFYYPLMKNEIKNK